MNIWIDLAEGQSDDAVKARSVVEQAVAEQRILCPLAAPLLWELMKQSYSSAVRVARLMDLLSQGVCFASCSEIHDEEIRVYIRNALSGGDSRPEREKLVVPVVSYLSSRSSVVFQDSWSVDDQHRFLGLAKTELQKITVTQLVEWSKESLPQPERPEPPAFSQAQCKRANFARGDRNRAWIAEAYSIFTGTVLPRLHFQSSRLPPRDQIRAVVAAAELPLDKFKSRLLPLFARLPSLLVRAEVMTLSGFDTNRRDRMSDFYDMEIMTVPLTYSDALASRDRWIRHMMRSKPVAMDESDWPPVPLLATFQDIHAFVGEL